MMLESLSDSSDRMIVRDRQGQEYRLQVNGDEDSYFIAKLLYRNSEVGRLQCVLFPPDGTRSMGLEYFRLHRRTSKMQFMEFL